MSNIPGARVKKSSDRDDRCWRILSTPSEVKQLALSVHPAVVEYYRQDPQKVYVFLLRVMAVGTGYRQSCRQAGVRE